MNPSFLPHVKTPWELGIVMSRGTTNDESQFVSPRTGNGKVYDSIPTMNLVSITTLKQVEVLHVGRTKGRQLRKRTAGSTKKETQREK